MSTAAAASSTLKGVKEICKDETVGKANKALDRVDERIVLPLAATLVYTWLLRFVAKESGPLPGVFMEVSIWGPILSSIGYFAFIFLGKKFMENREPFSLKNEMVTYNLFQAILNMYMGCSFVSEVYSQGQVFWGASMDMSPKGFHISFLIWMHYSNKYIELFDTVFMVLRKKNQQISFLHVYHHVLLIWSWWVVCKVAPGGDCYFGAMVNSFIHVIMYSYYLTALLGYNCFFKNWITLAQMAQFCICASQSLHSFFTGSVPTILPALQLFVMLNMLVLFGNFYRKAYSGKRDRKPAAAEKPREKSE